jgi:hypothetical protein
VKKLQIFLVFRGSSIWNEGLIYLSQALMNENCKSEELELDSTETNDILYVNS